MPLTPERVQFHSGGVRLTGVLYAEPRSGQRPGIVVCHGFGGLKEGTPPNVARHLASLGYVCLSFDYRGFGESGGPPGRLIPLEQVEDVRSAMAYLQTRSEVDPERVGLYGMSFGGGHVSYVAAYDRRVKCTVAVVAVTDGEAWLRDLHPYWRWVELQRLCEEDRRRRVIGGEGERVDRFEIMAPDPKTRAHYEKIFAAHPEQKVAVTLETIEAVMTYKPVEHSHRIRTPILWISAESDVLVSPQQTHAIFERCGSPNKSLVRLEGADHFELVHEGEHFRTTMRCAGEWLEKYLKVG